MNSLSIVDVDSILLPISGDSPSGLDPRCNTSSTVRYQLVRSLRSSARDSEKSSLYSGQMDDADKFWKKLEIESVQFLMHEAKDLDVATWLSESLVRRYGIIGLRDSLKIVLGLLREYWDYLYPMPDEDGLETRVAQFSGLNGRSSDGVLIAPLRRMSLISIPSSDFYSLFDYQQAVELERISDSDEKNQKTQTLGFSLGDIKKSVEELPLDTIKSSLNDLDEITELSANIESFIDDNCAIDDRPSLRTIVSVVDEFKSAIKHLSKDRIINEVEDTHISDEPDIIANDDKSIGYTGVRAEVAMSRETAFRQISEIATFFRKTEPHSPVAAMLERVVKWGDMSLNQLISELIPDDSARQHFTLLTGVETSDY